jgi:hypothetical protein
MSAGRVPKRLAHIFEHKLECKKTANGWAAE